MITKKRLQHIAYERYKLVWMIRYDKGLLDIFVLTDGEIAEEGTHDELMAKNGVYASMWEDYQKAAAWKIGGKES